MSIKQAYKDYLTLSAHGGATLMIIVFFRSYLQTNDLKMLYFGIALLIVSLFGVIARYFYVVDYIWTLLKSWR